MAPAEGVIRLDGQPLANAIISLKPKAGGRQSQGLSGEDGTFELGTFERGDGALIGEHSIAVNPIEPVPPAYMINPRSVPNYKPPFPSRYWTPNKSGLTATVESGRTNEIVLELTSTPSG